MRYFMTDHFLFSQFRLVEIFFAFCFIVSCLLHPDWANTHHIMCLRSTLPVYLHSHVSIGLTDGLQAAVFLL